MGGLRRDAATQPRTTQYLGYITVSLGELEHIYGQYYPGATIFSPYVVPQNMREILPTHPFRLDKELIYFFATQNNGTVECQILRLLPIFASRVKIRVV